MAKGGLTSEIVKDAGVRKDQVRLCSFTCWTLKNAVGGQHVLLFPGETVGKRRTLSVLDAA